MATKKAAAAAAAAAAADGATPAPRARLQTIYREKIVPELMTKFGFKSVMQVPRLTKITLNMGVSEAVADKKVMDHAVGDLTKISGQKPVVTKSRKAIAAFKIRENVPIGTMVTLRGVRMYEFLDRFVTIALPRVRDFRGISGRALVVAFAAAGKWVGLRRAHQRLRKAVQSLAPVLDAAQPPAALRPASP